MEIIITTTNRVVKELFNVAKRGFVYPLLCTHTLLPTHTGALTGAGGPLMPEQERVMMRTELRRSLCHAGRVGRAGSGGPVGTASTAQIVQQAGVQAPALSSTGLQTHSLPTKGCTVDGEDDSCSMCVGTASQCMCFHFFFPNTDTSNRTHPAVWCTNDMVSVFRLIAFEAGNCINQSWHLFYDGSQSTSHASPM